MIPEESEATAEIFVVEDNSADVYLIRKALEGRNLPHHLHVAEDGEEAVQLLNAAGFDLPCPDLLLIDLSLPKQDGHNLLQQARDHPACRSTPIIVISSSDSPKDYELAQRLDASFFRKPSDLEQFMRIADLIVEKLPRHKPAR